MDRSWAALLLDEHDDAVDLLLRDEGSMDACQLGSPRRHEEHVSGAQEGFGPELVEDRPGIHLRGDLEGDAGGEVCLDDTGNDVNGRPLGGQDQVDSRGGPSGPAWPVILHVALCHHHQVRQLIDDDHDVGKTDVFLRGLGNGGPGPGPPLPRQDFLRVGSGPGFGGADSSPKACRFAFLFFDFSIIRL